MGIGRRRVTLIAPHEFVNIGAVPVGLNIVWSRLDPDRIDSVAFPRGHELALCSVELEEGDGLLIPGSWFHHTRIDGLPWPPRYSFANLPLAVGGRPIAEWAATVQPRKGATMSFLRKFL